MSWKGVVVCEHTALLAQAETIDRWPADSPDCTAEPVGAWQVGISGGDATDRTAIYDRLGELQKTGVPATAALAALSRIGLPRCSILLSDGEYAAGLAWGVPLGLVELDRWEYALTTTDSHAESWQRLDDGTIVALDSCGPTVFPVPYPKDVR